MEKSLPRTQRKLQTKEVGQLVHKIIYLRILLHEVLGKLICKGILASAANKEKCSYLSASEANILRKLCQTWGELNKILTEDIKRQEAALIALEENVARISP